MRRKLDNQEDCRRLLAFVIREVEADKMEIPKAKLLIYAASTLSSVLSEHDVEQRLAELETRFGKKRAA